MQACSEQLFSGSSIGDTISQQHPVLAENASIAQAHLIRPHQHIRGQFIFAVSGTINLMYQNKQWHFNRDKIAWIPSGYYHSVASTGPVEYRSLFIDASICAELSVHPAIFQLTSLIRALTKEAAIFSSHYRPETPESRLVTVLLDQLKILTPSSLNLPLPSDPRLRSAVHGLLDSPSIRFNAALLAEQCHMSTRSMERHFKSQTGISFGDWLRRLVLLKAIELIQDGSTIKKTALHFGYRNTSAFTAMFRRETGLSPTAYFQNIH